MAFDKSLPSTQTKIRNYSTVLTSNFGAIEEGQDTLQQWKINLIERNAIPSAPAVNPTRVDNVMQLYSKQNADSLTDLYVLDDRATANIIELTENGKLGGRAQQAVFQDIAIGTNAFVNDQNSFIFAYGVIPATGASPRALSPAVGLGEATIGTVGSDANAYTITFSGRNPSNTNYLVFCICESSRASGLNGVRLANLIPGSKTTNEFSIRVQNNGSNTNVTNAAVQIIVIGGF